MRQPILSITPLLALTATDAAQQKQPPTSDKEKVEEARAERFKKVAAPMIAEEDQRKVIIQDLIKTCVECRGFDAAYLDAQPDSDQQRTRLILSKNCYMTLQAKLARIPLDTLAPHTQVIKGVDVELSKWRAINIICDAYEYGLQQAKKPVDK